MVKVTQTIKTKANPKKVWKAWMDMYKWNNKNRSSSAEKGLKEGGKGVIIQDGKKASYSITHVYSGKSFKMKWGNIFVRFTFHYLIDPLPKGSSITCNVYFGGMFGFLSSLFIKKKIKKNLVESLNTFVEQLELSQMQMKRIYK